MSADIRTCPDCGRRFTGAEMAAESFADLESRVVALSEQMRTDATFGRMTGLGDEWAMDVLEVAAMAIHPDNIDVPEDDADEDVDPWVGERCWQCTLRAEGGRGDGVD